GTAPVSTMYDYARDVMQYTHGKGRLTCSFKGYAPCHNAEEVIAAIGYDCDGDTDNPCDSVFCAHGAGYVVKWNEVKSHMHLPSVLSAPKSEYVETGSSKTLSRYKDRKDLFALDKELMQIFEQTYGPIKNRSHDRNRGHFTFTENAEKSR